MIFPNSMTISNGGNGYTLLVSFESQNSLVKCRIQTYVIIHQFVRYNTLKYDSFRKDSYLNKFFYDKIKTNF